MKMYRMAYDAQEAKEERLLENCLAQIRVYDLHVHTVHTYIIYTNQTVCSIHQVRTCIISSTVHV
jgi:hypothetical protein